jgi:hypothetical protein
MALVVKASAGATIEVNGVRFVTKRSAELVFLDHVESLKRDGTVIGPKPKSEDA